MLTKYLGGALICLLLLTANSVLISAQTQTAADDSAIAKVKADVVKRGKVFGEPVNLKMRSGARLKGLISQPDEDSFEFTDSKTKQSSTIFYKDVAKVSKIGWSNGAKIAVIAALAGAAVAVLYVLAPVCNEGGC